MDKPSKKPSVRVRQAMAAVGGGLLILLVLMLATPDPGARPTKVALSVAMADINQGKASTAQIDDQDHTVLLTLNAAGGSAKITTTYPLAYSSELTTQLLTHDVKTTTAAAKSKGVLLNVFLTFGPIVLILAFLYYVMQTGKLGGNIGKFAGKRGQSVGDIPTERFTDVAGADEAVAELRELVEFLSDGERFTRLGAKPPKGALLTGPPGTGKTLLARAVAGEAGVPFFALSGSDFVEVFAGVGAKRARDLFDRAKTAGKSIIFIDEVDSIARRRGDAHSIGGGGDREGEQTLNALLSEMDGFTASQVIVLAATNRPDVLDPAITRPGRLDRRIQVGNPDRGGRTAILGVHTTRTTLADDVDLVAVARQTPGMSGAELAQVVNEACMEAARHNRPAVTAADFRSAIPTVTMGRSRTSALVTESDRLVTAWHESGHALAALLQPAAPDPVSVTIVPRGASGGATHMTGDDSQYLSRQQALAQLTVMMAGRAGEEVLLHGEYTQGAGSDLAAASDLARRMVTEYGMTGFGLATIDADALRMGGEVANRAHRHINDLLSAAHVAATDLLREHRDLLRAVAETLLAEETLSLAQILALRDGTAAAA